MNHYYYCVVLTVILLITDERPKGSAMKKEAMFLLPIRTIEYCPNVSVEILGVSDFEKLKSESPQYFSVDTRSYALYNYRNPRFFDFWVLTKFGHAIFVLEENENTRPISTGYDKK